MLNDIHPGGFEHNVQSLRVVDVIESTDSRRGMNLTEEVRDGILGHSGSYNLTVIPSPVEKIEVEKLQKRKNELIKLLQDASTDEEKELLMTEISELITKLARK